MPFGFAWQPSKHKISVWYTFVQRWNNVKDIGPTLYKCYTICFVFVVNIAATGHAQWKLSWCNAEQDIKEHKVASFWADNVFFCSHHERNFGHVRYVQNITWNNIFKDIATDATHCATTHQEVAKSKNSAWHIFLQWYTTLIIGVIVFPAFNMKAYNYNIMGCS